MRTQMIAVALLILCLNATAHAKPKVESVACNVLVGLPAESAATCGYLYVAENRADPKSKMIRVPFVHARSKRQPSLADPVFVIPGGPGERAFYPGYLDYQPALATRDVVWVDQRGTELGKPSLQCPEYEEATQRALQGMIDGEQLASAQVDAARICADRARAQGIDLLHYSSRDIAEDIEDLRQLLGFEQVNLYAISYGGRIASILLRLHPRSVKTLVLNSPLPIEANYDEFGSVNMQRTLDLVFDECRSDMKCSRAFPDLRSEFSQVIASAERTPSEIVVESEAFPGRKTPVRVTDWVLANAILGQLYSPYSLQPLPGRIRAISRGDKEALRSIVGADPSRNALLQRLAVWCNDEYPFENVDAIRRQRTAFAQFAGVDQSTVPIGACKAAGLDRPTEGSTDNTAISSEKPILIFAGQYDPTIPPSWISTMTEHLPNAYVAMFPSQAHGAGFNECGWTMMQSFLDSPTNTPDASCLLHERSLDFSGSSTGKFGNASGD